MRKNRLIEQWQTGNHTLNGWLHIPSSWSAELMAHAGWDSVTIDLQHSFASMETVLTMLQAISTTDTVPLVRPTHNDPAQMQRLLDMGAYGIICPMINTAAECQQFVDACRYPPQGNRSFGPTRARVYGGADYPNHANEQIVTLAMVETAESVANLDAILAVEGLTGIFVGPGDLALTMTNEMGQGQHPDVQAAIKTIVDKTRAAGKVAAIWSPNEDVAAERHALGYQMLTVSSDGYLLDRIARHVIKTLRK